MLRMKRSGDKIVSDPSDSQWYPWIRLSDQGEWYTYLFTHVKIDYIQLTFLYDMHLGLKANLVNLQQQFL